MVTLWPNEDNACGSPWATSARPPVLENGVASEDTKTIPNNFLDITNFKLFAELPYRAGRSP